MDVSTSYYGIPHQDEDLRVGRTGAETTSGRKTQMVCLASKTVVDLETLHLASSTENFVEVCVRSCKRKTRLACDFPHPIKKGRPGLQGEQARAQSVESDAASDATSVDASVALKLPARSTWSLVTGLCSTKRDTPTWWTSKPMLSIFAG